MPTYLLWQGKVHAKAKTMHKNKDPSLYHYRKAGASMKLSIFKTEIQKASESTLLQLFHGFQMAALKPSAHSQWPVLAQIINHQTTAATPSVQTVAKLLLQDSEALRNDAHSTNMMNDFGFVRCRESAYNYNKLRASIAKVIISGRS